ncbi:rCG41951, isoform CRA_b [Rattus norvegicus]|uniref:RCG41951, isoform CRA_b n=1 Tax=Rattus norvegicus TaxID=10116 RepID=A6JUY3_RAT|nr:rCG41951, isoform CRA_b [Rattus norvegicus]
MAAALTFRRLLALPRAARGFGVRVSRSGEKITHTGQVTAVPAMPGTRD